MPKNGDKTLRMRHRITRQMELVQDIMDEIHVNPGAFEPLYAEDNAPRIFALLPGLWPAYCQGWADYHAYESWPAVGRPVRAQLRPLPSKYGAAANEAGWTLPASATFVTRLNAADSERALRRTGFMLQQVWVYLNLGVGNGHGLPIRDGVLMDSPQLAFFYMRGWKDRQDTFRLETVTRPRAGPELVVPAGTFVGPRQHMIMAIQFAAPASQDPRRMLVSHYVDGAPDSQVVVELGSIDEADFDLHIDLVQVMNEEYYSPALYRYLHGDGDGPIHVYYDEHAVHDAWRRPPAAELRGDAEGSEDGPGGGAARRMPARERARAQEGGGVVAAERRGEPVGQEDPARPARGEPVGSEEPVDLDDLIGRL